MNELYKKYKKDMESAYIKANKDGIQITGSETAILTLFAQISTALLNSGSIKKEQLINAIEDSSKSSEELLKEIFSNINDIFELKDKIKEIDEFLKEGTEDGK